MYECTRILNAIKHTRATALVSAFLFVAALFAFVPEEATAQQVNVTDLGKGFGCLDSLIYNKKGKVIAFKKAKRSVRKKLKRLNGRKGKKAVKARKALKMLRLNLKKCNKGELAQSASAGLRMDTQLCTGTENDATVTTDPAQPGRLLVLQVSDNGGATWNQIASGQGASGNQTTLRFVSPNDAGVYNFRLYSSAAAGFSAILSQSLEVTVSDCGGTIATPALPLVRAGGSHTCAIDTSGATWCWGENTRGQIGDGTNEERLSPALVAGEYNFVELAVGAYHTCGLEQDGKAYCWGQNMSFDVGPGALGDGSEEDRNVPTPVAGGHKFMTLAAGIGHTCGLTFQGFAYCWGANGHGQLGDGKSAPESGGWDYNSLTPSRVSGSSNYVQIDAKGWQSCARTSAGRIDCWGDNPYNADGYYTGDAIVPEPQSSGYVDLAIGSSTRCGLKSSGAGYCWGSESQGSFGNGGGQSDPSSSEPIAIAGGFNFVDITMANRGGCGLTASGNAYCWGYNVLGAVGDGAGGSISSNRVSPVEVFTIREFRQIDGGSGHVCAVSTTGGVYCWGNNTQGQIGNGSKGLGASAFSPVYIPLG